MEKLHQVTDDFLVCDQALGKLHLLGDTFSERFVTDVRKLWQATELHELSWGYQATSTALVDDPELQLTTLNTFEDCLEYHRGLAALLQTPRETFAELELETEFDTLTDVVSIARKAAKKKKFEYCIALLGLGYADFLPLFHYRLADHLRELSLSREPAETDNESDDSIYEWELKKFHPKLDRQVNSCLRKNDTLLEKAAFYQQTFDAVYGFVIETTTWPIGQIAERFIGCEEEISDIFDLVRNEWNMAELADSMAAASRAWLNHRANGLGQSEAFRQSENLHRDYYECLHRIDFFDSAFRMLHGIFKQ